MASPTWWTIAWANSRSWWWTGKPGVLQSWGRKELDTTEQLNWTEVGSHAFLVVTECPTPLMGRNLSSLTVLWLGGPEQRPLYLFFLLNTNEEYSMVDGLWAVNDRVFPIHPLMINPYSILVQLPQDAKCFTVLSLKDAFFCIPVHLSSSQYLFIFTVSVCLWVDQLPLGSDATIYLDSVAFGVLRQPTLACPGPRKETRGNMPKRRACSTVCRYIDM